MRLHKMKQALLWELHDAWSFPFAEILLIGFLTQILSVTFITVRPEDVNYLIFERLNYPIIIFCTLMPAKVYGECIEKRKIHIPLMSGISRSELFTSKLMVAVFPIWAVQLGSLLVLAVLNCSFAFPFSIAVWISVLISVLVFSLFVCSFSTLFSILLKRFSLASLTSIGLLVILDYWALRMPFENWVGYLSPMKSTIVLHEVLLRQFGKIIADTDVLQAYPPVAYALSIPYLLLLPLLFMLVAAIVFRVIDLD
jgi:hypothetical protein